MEMKRTLKVLRKSHDDKRRWSHDASMQWLGRFIAVSMAAIAALVFCNLGQALSAGLAVLPPSNTHPSFETSSSISADRISASSTSGLAYAMKRSPLFRSGTSKAVVSFEQKVPTSANVREPPNHSQSIDSLVAQKRKPGRSTESTVVPGRTNTSPSTSRRRDSGLKNPPMIPSEKSRFDVPWNRIPDTHLLSLAESGHRVLLSSISSYANSGLGHMMAVLNSEVHTSLILGLTYTHRRGIYGALSIRNSTVTSRVDDFFGWGRNEIARDDVYQNFCEGASENKYLKVGDTLRILRSERPCTVCRSVRNPGVARTAALKGMNVNRVIQVPSAVSLSQCNSHYDPELKSFSCRASKALREEHNKTQHALFHVGVSVCDKLPAKSDFSQTKGWFYWRFWDADVVRLRNELEHTDLRAPRDEFVDTELSIAIHARRGDFFQEANMKRGRVLVSMRTYAAVVQNILGIVNKKGNPFAALPVRVYIYSEGRRGKHVPNSDAHDPATMTSEFVDSDGVVLDGKWIANLIGHNVRVSMRISTPTLSAVHEMAKADWFIGSVSGLSTHVVGTLSRGIRLLPMRNCGDSHKGIFECFEPTNGSVPTGKLSDLWEEYSNNFQRYLPGHLERP